jgi:hypothetical protein
MSRRVVAKRRRGGGGAGAKLARRIRSGNLEAMGSFAFSSLTGGTRVAPQPARALARVGRHESLLSALVALLLAPLPGCLQTSGGAPLRSPSNDYRPAPPTTSDGEVIGADRKAPADKLAEGPTNSGAAPGWKVDSSGVSHDPKARVGGAIDRSDNGKPPPAAPPPRKPKPAPAPD